MKYRTIVADPPWTYDDPEAFNTGSWAKMPNGGERGSRVAACEQYPILALDDICAMPVADHTVDDAYLWLWIPNEHLLKGVHQQVCDAWGFTVKGSMVWVKNGAIGLGYWLRYNHEHVVFAVRGQPGPLLDRALPSVLTTTREAHSAKPEAFYMMVERACPGPYLDLFARKQRGEQEDIFQPRKEWTVWGNEVGDPLGIGFGPWK